MPVKRLKAFPSSQQRFEFFDFFTIVGKRFFEVCDKLRISKFDLVHNAIEQRCADTLSGVSSCEFIGVLIVVIEILSGLGAVL